MLYKLATSSISLIRWSAFKAVGVAETDAIIIKDLDGTDPLLYAAKKAIGHRQLTEDEARDTARRAYSKNTSLRSADIGKAIGRSRQTVDSYTADLRAATQLGLDTKIFRMHPASASLGTGLQRDWACPNRQYPTI